MRESLFSGGGGGGGFRTRPDLSLGVAEIEPRSSEDLMVELVVGGLQAFSLSRC